MPKNRTEVDDTILAVGSTFRLENCPHLLDGHYRVLGKVEGLDRSFETIFRSGDRSEEGTGTGDPSHVLKPWNEINKALRAVDPTAKIEFVLHDEITVVCSEECTDAVHKCLRKLISEHPDLLKGTD